MYTVGIDVKLSWFGKLLETLVSSSTLHVCTLYMVSRQLDLIIDVQVCIYMYLLDYCKRVIKPYKIFNN